MNAYESPELFRRATETANATPVENNKVNILIVDDLPEKLLVYEMILKDMGYNLVMARSGKEALKFLLQDEFAVILLDVNMPEIDGFETAATIRSRKKCAHTPIIFLTAFVDELRVNQGYASGAVDYLPTPVVPQILKAKVKVFVELFLMRQQAAIQGEERARRIIAEEADRHKDQFLGMLAHELRNPLGPIVNAVHMMKGSELERPRQQKLLEVIERQVTHMAHLVDDLLDATRLARGQMLLRKTRCDLSEIVAHTAEDYRNLFSESGLKFIVKTPALPVWIEEGDETRLAQAIGNLLHNAHKFTPPGGEVSIVLENNEEEGFARIRVADSGAGISGQMLPRVFDVFYQAEQGLDHGRGGLGLGLALVKGLINLHNGTVSIESAGLNKGTTVTLRLPSDPAYEETAPSVNPPAEIELKKRRVLIIEDNPDAAETARMLLEMDGHDVRMCLSGKEGLKTAHEFYPDIILCDIGLPSMDGYEVAHAVREDDELRSIYLIALTGYGRDDDRSRTKEAGFNMHLTKPIDVDYLRRAVVSLP